MASVVTEGCVECGACAEVCPVGAISDLTDSDGNSQMIINPNICIDCGMCISECPQGAIKTQDEADEKWIVFNKEKSQQ